MTIRRIAATCLIPLLLLGGCQSSATSNSTPSERIQGNLVATVDGWQIQSCEQKNYALNLHEQDPLSQALKLVTDKSTLQVDAALKADDTRYQISKLYRLHASTEGSVFCEEPTFRQLKLKAQGNEPSWNIQLSKEGLVLQRMGQEPLALPVVEEHLPDGRIAISSQANTLNLNLWLVPELCQDTMIDSISHLKAQLTLNDEQLTGCGYVGSASQ